MIGSRAMLPELWYVHEDEFELESMFPADQDVKLLRGILDATVVEREEKCLPDANASVEVG